MTKWQHGEDGHQQTRERGLSEDTGPANALLSDSSPRNCEKIIPVISAAWPEALCFVMGARANQHTGSWSVYIFIHRPT